MKAQKLTSILLCSLIASTIAHDVLRARHFAEEARASRAISPFENRASPSGPQQCSYICSSTGGSTEFELYLNETTNLIGVVNVTAKVAFIFDINANIVALFNGNDGSAVIININTQKGNYIAPGQSNKVWISEKISFELYFNSLTTLTILLDIGTSFTVKTCPTNVLKVIASLLVYLSSSLSVQIGGDLNVALQILLQIGTKLSVVLNGSLKGFLQFAGKGAIRLFGDLIWLVGVFDGLGAFFGQISGGLSALIKAKVQFDLALIFGAASGIELLVNLVLAIVARLGVSVVANLLNNVELLLEFIVKLGGGVSYGVTGIFKIVLLIVKVTNKKIQIGALIQALLEFAVYRAKNPNTEIDISVQINGLLQLIEVIKSSNGSTSVDLKIFIDFVQKLQSGNLVIGGINISSVIKLLAGVIKNALQLVVSILILLNIVITYYISIPTLLFILLQSITSTAGVHLLFDLGIITSININLVAEIIKSVNLQTILRLILSGFNLDSVLKAIPIVNNIYAALTVAVSSASSGSLSLSVTIQSSGSASVTTEIKAWVKSTLKLSGSSIQTSTTKSIIGGIIGGLFG